MKFSRADITKRPFRQDGRLIVSYPKSGRTWIGFAFSSFGIDATATHAGSSTNRREIGRPFAGILPALRDTPVVFLHRDPIDTAVSMFYQIRRRDFRPWTGRWLRMMVPLALRGALPPRKIDDFVRHPIYGVGNICKFNATWLAHVANRDDCMVLRYEELRANPAEGFQHLLDFFGVSHATGADLAAASDFDQMKKAEMSQHAKIAARTVVGDPTTFKVRRGKVAGFHDELKPETVAECMAIVARYAATRQTVEAKRRFTADPPISAGYSA